MKNKLIILLITILFTIMGCGSYKQITAAATGYSKVCVDGVTYLQFASGVTVQVDQNNKPVSCNQ